MSNIEKALNKKNDSIIPIWIMRQAGRYLEEYRKVRQQAGSFLELCYNPELATEVTLQPIRRFNFDAAIIFSDILLIPQALGVNLTFLENEGPSLDKINIEHDLDRLDLINLEKKLDNIYKAISLTRAKLAKETSLIGFCGSPWTLSAYMIEGKSNKDFFLTRKTAYHQEDKFKKLIDILTKAVSRHLIKQIESGANIVQLFDSWCGVLSYEQFEKWVIEPTKEIIFNIRQKYADIPIICFPKGAGLMYKAYADIPGISAVGIDTTTNMQYAIKELNQNIALQGNLDPAILLTDKKTIEKYLQKLLKIVPKERYIFNLGHGILPPTPVENVQFLVDFIRNYK